MLDHRRNPLCALPLAALALLGACSGGQSDSGGSANSPPGTVAAEVLTVTPIYRLVPAPVAPGCTAGQAGVAAAGARQPCGPAGEAAQREPDGFDVAYRYDGGVHHTHTDYRPGAYLQVNADTARGG